MTKQRTTVLAIAALAALAGGAWAVRRAIHPHRAKEHPNAAGRRTIWEEIQPVALTPCRLARFGSANDGGYVMCADLLTGVASAYSYGIDREDNWGCQISTQLHVPVHQYDCFTPERPTCATGAFDFHAECIGPAAAQLDGRPFDTLAGQIARNGDAGKTLVVKIDVEGAEIDSLLATPNDVLDKIVQLPMELHGFGGNLDQPRFLALIRKLKETFYVASVHFNNYECRPAPPLPGPVFQLLWVNKRLAKPDPSAPLRAPGSSPDAPDNPAARDCQPVAWAR